MLDEESLDYFRRRERAERAAAKNAASDAARRVHQELALEYAELLRRSAGPLVQAVASASGAMRSNLGGRP